MKYQNQQQGKANLNVIPKDTFIPRLPDQKTTRLYDVMYVNGKLITTDHWNLTNINFRNRMAATILGYLKDFLKPVTEPCQYMENRGKIIENLDKWINCNQKAAEFNASPANYLEQNYTTSNTVNELDNLSTEIKRDAIDILIHLTY